MSRREEKIKNFVRTNVEQRLKHHQHHIFMKNELIDGWKEMRIDEDFEETSLRRDLVRCLFVVFSRKNMEDFIEVELQLSFQKKHQVTELVSKFLAEDTSGCSDAVAHKFVSDSIYRRMEILKTEAVTHEIAVKGWQGLSLDSDNIYFQLHEIFRQGTEDAISAYESNIFFEAKLVFSSNLLYANTDGMLLPDGSRFYGFGVMNDDQLSVSIEDLSSMPEFVRTSSSESCILDCTKQFIQPKPALSSSSKSIQSSLKSSSSSSLVLKLKPPKERFSDLSILSAAVAAKQADLVSKLVPDTFFSTWDQLNMEWISDRDLPVQEKEIGPVFSSTESNSSDDGEQIPFHTQYTTFCELFDKHRLGTEESILKARQMLEWLVGIVFHLEDHQLGARIFPISRSKLTDENTTMLLFFHDIKKRAGSLYFVFFLLQSKRFD